MNEFSFRFAMKESRAVQQDKKRYSEGPINVFNL